MKSWSIALMVSSLITPIYATANETSKIDISDIDVSFPTCIKPKTKQSFNYVECLNKKGVARVGNLIQTPFGEFAYPLGLVNKDGETILPNEYHQIDYPQDWGWDYSLPASDALILVIKRDLNNNPMFSNLGVDELYGLVNAQGEFVVTLGIYDTISPFYDNGLAAVSKNGKYGFIDTSGQIIIPLIYDNTHGFDTGFAIVNHQGKYGVIDNHHHTVIDLNYQSVRILNSPNNTIYFAIKSDDKYALFDKNQKQLSGFLYDFISVIYFSELFIIADKGGYGVMDSTGKIIIPTQYDYINDTLMAIDDDYNSPNKYIKVSKDNQSYYFDTTGKLVFSK